MPRRKTPVDQRASKLERARRHLTGGGVIREDSDDELGLDDIPWEWIYHNAEEESEGSDGSDLEDDLSAEQLVPTVSTVKKRRVSKCSRRQATPIIGARMGSFECRIGDCVLLKADSNNEAWVGLICEFRQDEEHGMSANFMWFSTEKEIRNKGKKRMDFLPNELYITPSWDLNPLASINGKAIILSAEVYKAKYPMGKIPRNSRDYGKTFICRRGCNTRTATYTEEFIWEDIFSGTEQDIYNLIQRVKSETKATRKRNPSKTAVDEDSSTDSAENHDTKIFTPRKKRRVSLSTPQKHQSLSRNLTPTNKRVIVKKPLEFTPLGTRILHHAYVGSSPFQIARSKLHVSAVPATLPCREDEFSEVYSYLENAITDGSGSCIYISGTPGTGKTATVREVVGQLNAAVMAEELDDFIFVEINGMKVTDPHQSYSLLWEALKGDRVSPTQALDLLEREFNHPSPRRVPCVVLMDELDQLVTKNQSVMYNFFNWPGLRHSRLIVLAVANTMDLPERTLSNKISSRIGMHRITFGGYNHEQLMKIIQSRLKGVSGGIVESDAVQFASRKVAAVSGDARRALDICRRAVELAEAACLNDPKLLTDPAPQAFDESRRERLPKGRVTISTIKQAINEVTASPLQQHLRGLSLSSKLLLAALLTIFRRTGLRESILGEIIVEAKRMVKMSASTNMIQLLATDVLSTAKGRKSNNRSRNAARVHAIGFVAVELMEAGIIGLETKRGDRTGKIRLCIGEEDVKQALKDDPDVGGLGLS